MTDINFNELIDDSVDDPNMFECKRRNCFKRSELTKEMLREVYPEYYAICVKRKHVQQKVKQGKLPANTLTEMNHELDGCVNKPIF